MDQQNLNSLAQLVHTLEEAINRLDTAIKQNNLEDTKKLKQEIINLKESMDKLLK